MLNQLRDLTSGIAVMLIIFFYSPLIHAATTLRIPGGGQIIVSAEGLEGTYEAGHRHLVLTKGVKIIFNQQVLVCDRAVVDEATQTIEATGGMILSSLQAYIEGDAMTLNYATNTGTITNGFMKSGQVVLEGKVINKTGDQTYEAESAYFTACTTCPTAWTFRGTRINAELGGYARIKNPILEVGGLPVIWLPYLVVPLKSERQTGWLVPLIVPSSAGGSGLGMSYFWAISRSQDMTFTALAYTKRGFKGDLDYRYMLSPSSYGEFKGAALRDHAFEGEVNSLRADQGLSPITTDKNNRWFLTYDHVYEMPYGITQRTHLNFVSDLRYGRDFPDEMNGQGDPALDNRVSLWRNTENTHASAEVNYYINQLRTDPTTPNENAVNRWPSLNYAIAEREIGATGLLFNLQTNYVNFSRDGFAWDDVVKNRPAASGPSAPINSQDGLDPVVDAKRNTVGKTSGRPGVFDPDTDILRAGQRLDIMPEISYPFHIGPYLDILPALMFRHTQYAFSVDSPVDEPFNSTPYRQYLRAQISARTNFSRVYGHSEAPPAKPLDLAIQANRDWADTESQGLPQVRPANLYRHEIQPEIVFTGVPKLNFLPSSNSPFFGTDQLPIFLANQPASDADFFAGRQFQFDYFDRQNDRNNLSFAIENKLVRKSYLTDIPEYKQIARVRLAQTYDFDEARRANSPQSGRTFPYSDLSALIDVRLDNFETNSLFQYFPYHNVTNTSSRVRFINKNRNFIEVNYAQTYLITENVTEAYKGRTDNVGFGAGYESKYIAFYGGIDFQPSHETDQKQPFKLGVKGWTTQLGINPPGNCWGIHAAVIQNIGDPPTWKINFEYKFGGEAPVTAAKPG
jgi:LPS-assembly protein